MVCAVLRTETGTRWLGLNPGAGFPAQSLRGPRVLLEYVLVCEQPVPSEFHFLSDVTTDNFEIAVHGG
jgi:hypothetical protein